MQLLMACSHLAGDAAVRISVKCIGIVYRVQRELGDALESDVYAE